jgi:hypothetical protein
MIEKGGLWSVGHTDHGYARIVSLTIVINLKSLYQLQTLRQLRSRVVHVICRTDKSSGCTNVWVVYSSNCIHKLTILIEAFLIYPCPSSRNSGMTATIPFLADIRNDHNISFDATHNQPLQRRIITILTSAGIGRSTRDVLDWHHDKSKPRTASDTRYVTDVRNLGITRSAIRPFRPLQRTGT